MDAVGVAVTGVVEPVAAAVLAPIEAREEPIDKLLITNTIPLTGDRATCQKIVVLSVARLLGQAIRSIHEETSVSSLFV